MNVSGHTCYEHVKHKHTSDPSLSLPSLSTQQTLKITVSLCRLLCLCVSSLPKNIIAKISAFNCLKSN